MSLRDLSIGMVGVGEVSNGAAGTGLDTQGPFY